MSTINYLIVAGGGAGGTGSGAGFAGSGGGGAGGIIARTGKSAGGGSYPVVVGAGGTTGGGGANPTNGSNSSFNGEIAIGGGAAGQGFSGPAGSKAGAAGGSGGGGGGDTSITEPGGTATSGQGNVGGDGKANGTSPAGGGGGGAGVAGTTAVFNTGGAGGNGVSDSTSGTPVTYGGGGGGCGWNGGVDGVGGTGGGGAANSAAAGANGTVNLGGGGGGGGTGGGTGGSGVVIISYVTGALAGASGGSITTSGGNTIHTFTASGTFAFTSTLPVSVNRDFPNPIQFYRRSNFMRQNVGFQTAPPLTLLLPPPAPMSPTPVITIAGVISTLLFDLGSITIEDSLNEQANILNAKVRGTMPTIGQEIIVGLGSIDAVNRIFAGSITSVSQGYEASPKGTLNIFWAIQCADYTWLLNRRRPTGQFVVTSATTVILSLFSSFSSGFDVSSVPAGLSNITISFDGSQTFAQCLTNICNLIGYHWDMGYNRDIKVYTAASSANDPTPININNVTTMVDPMVSYDIDLTQIRTRVTGRGVSVQLQADILDAETLVPVESVLSFNPVGGLGYINHIPVVYTGTTPATGGSFLGAGASPSSPPVAVASTGAGLGLGTYKYAYTDVTAAGESIPSPLATVVTFTLTAPPSAPTIDASNQTNEGTSAWSVGETVEWATANSGAATAYDVTNVTALSPISSFVAIASVAFPGFAAVPTVAWVASTDPNVKWTHIYRRRSSGGGFVLINSFAPPSNGPVVFNYFGNGTAAPSANPSSQQVSLSSVAVGTSPTTSRKIYRTAVNASQLKLVNTIANNTATTYGPDSLADGSLGANAPVTDTSGLVLTAGTLFPGSTSVPVASLANFSAAGGWALSGGVQIRFTGISSTALTGVPASGAGSITSPINYGTTIIPLSVLTGVTGGLASAKGSPVGILITVDDPAAQSALGLLEGGDGIHVFQFTDTTIVTETELTQVCNAQLALFNTPTISVTEAARDTKTKAGQTLVVSLPAPMSLTASLLIQQVSISHVGTEIGQYPQYVAKASSVKFTLQDLLRQLGGLSTGAV